MSDSGTAVGLTETIPAGARVCAAHQPNLLPWAGYFAKMYRADVFVIADTVQYVKLNFVNRCRIADRGGPRWLSVPVLRRGRFGQTERDVRIDNHQRWRDKFWKSLKHRYGKSPLFPTVGMRIGEQINRSHEHLLDLNLALLGILRDCLGIQTPVVLLSETGVTTEDRCGRIVQTTKAVGCTHYLSGKGGSKGYLTNGPFEEAGISYSFFSYQEPPYPQASPSFLPGCSVIDSLFRVGVDETRSRIGML
jgi:hypothetical protein